MEGWLARFPATFELIKGEIQGKNAVRLKRPSLNVNGQGGRQGSASGAPFQGSITFVHASFCVVSNNILCPQKEVVGCAADY